VHILHTYRNI